ncbi:protein ENL-like [Scomber japonicus]|uniref:protein ENL-like n=1 Tax=Scomber japonicus TaxID=13676 RepID=UPI0023069FA9|nr:protein ENL-like [Scomber japonicus]
MENQSTVQLNLELGHRAQLKEKETSESFTHDWTIFVRGPETGDIQQLVEKVVFHLHDGKPKRVCKEPPYEVDESGSTGFLVHVEVHFKNKVQPKKMCFKYDLFLNPEGKPVDHLRCETLTFNNPTKEFRRKLIKAGGAVKAVPEGAEAVSRPSPDCPMPPTKKIKIFHVSENQSKEGSGDRSESKLPDQGAL